MYIYIYIFYTYFFKRTRFLKPHTTFFISLSSPSLPFPPPAILPCYSPFFLSFSVPFCLSVMHWTNNHASRYGSGTLPCMPSNEHPAFVAATSCYAKKTKGQRGCSVRVFGLWSRVSYAFYIRKHLLLVYPVEYVRYDIAWLSLSVDFFSGYPEQFFAWRYLSRCAI